MHREDFVVLNICFCLILEALSVQQDVTAGLEPRAIQIYNRGEIQAFILSPLQIHYI
jgi:hypothetical protein